MLIAIVGIYFAIMFYIGYRASQRVKNSSDYYLGGKSFGPWFTAFKFASTWESGVKLVGTPGMAWNVGYAAFVQGMATPLCYFFSFRVFGQRLKTACDHFNVITVPELLERRYKSKTIRVLAALTIIIGLGGSLMAQYKATGEIFSSILGIEYLEGLLLGVLVVGIYSVMGGYLASVWTDLLQGIVMSIGSFIIFFATAYAVFGTIPGDLFAQLNVGLQAINPDLLDLHAGGKMPWSQIVIILAITLLVGVALPQQAVAIFSMRDVRVARSALVICTMFSAILAWTLLPTGMMGRLLLDSAEVKNPDMVIPLLINKVLNPVLAGIFLAAILSAIMSTVDGAIMVAASALTEDVMNIVAPDLYNSRPVFFNRLAAGLFVFIPLILAIDPPTIVFWIAVFSFGFLVFTFLMPMVGVILIKHVSPKAVIIQMVTTMIVIPVWVIYLQGVTGIPALLVGLLGSPVLFLIANALLRTEADKSPEIDTLWATYKRLGV